MFSGLMHCPLFWMVFAGTTALQMIIMLVPGIRLVFRIYECKLDLDPDTGIDRCGGVVQYGISWQTWLINIGLALLTIPLKFLVTFFKAPTEFKVKADKMSESE